MSKELKDRPMMGQRESRPPLRCSGRRARQGAAVTVALLALGCSAPQEPSEQPSPTPVQTPSTAPTEAAATSTPTPSSEGEPVRNPELDDDLIAAAWANDLDLAEDLIGHGASVNAMDETEQSAYLIATSEGFFDLLQLTFEHGADVQSLDSFNGTGLIRSAERGHADISGLLITEGVEIDHVNRLGWTALHEALEFAERAGGQARGDESDYVDTVRVLVAAGADVALTSERDQRTPLQLARDHGLDDQAELISEAVDADAEQVDESQANRRLLEAAESGDADAAALALRAGAELETRNDLQQTPLLLASANDHAAVARLLVYLGADPDAVDHQSDTPWLVTGVTGSVEMLEILLPTDPDLALTNRFGGLSPIPAAERGHVAYIDRVVETEVDLDHVNDLGWTALLEAVILGDGSEPYQEIVQTLVEAGVDTSIADRDGISAKQHAERRGYDEIVDLL